MQNYIGFTMDQGSWVILFSLLPPGWGICTVVWGRAGREVEEKSLKKEEGCRNGIQWQ